MNNSKMIPLEYVNSLMYELEKAFWDERGRGARFRMTTVGREYYRDKVRPLIQSSDLDHILQTVREVLRSEGIAEMSHTTRMAGCCAFSCRAASTARLSKG
jgi:hypothetical protein